MGEKEVNRTTEKEQKHVDETKHPKKQKHRNLILGMMGIVIVAGVTITAKVIIPSQKYEQAETLLEKGKYMEMALLYLSYVHYYRSFFWSDYIS